MVKDNPPVDEKKSDLKELGKKYFPEGITEYDKAMILIYKKQPDRLSAAGKIIAKGLMEMFL